MERDDVIISLVNKHQVLTCELTAALLGMEHTHSNLNIVERRLRLLSEQKHFAQVLQDNVTYTVSYSVSLRKTGTRAQLLHRAMQSRFWGTLHAAVPVAMQKTDREFRLEKGPLVPDGFCQVHNGSFFVECNTGRDSFDNVLKKAREYDRQKDYLCRIYDLESFRVLWVSRSPDRAGHMLAKFVDIGSGGLFLVTTEREVNPFIPASILTCWLRPIPVGKVPPLEG